MFSALKSCWVVRCHSKVINTRTQALRLPSSFQFHSDSIEYVNYLDYCVNNRAGSVSEFGVGSRYRYSVFSSVFLCLVFGIGISDVTLLISGHYRQDGKPVITDCIFPCACSALLVHARRHPAGIVFTHRPIFRFFAPQGQHTAPISEIWQGGADR